MAPQVDRLAVAVHPLTRPRMADAAGRAGLFGGTGLLVPLAAPLLAGPAAAGDLHAVVRYTPWSDFVAAVRRHVDQGLLDRAEDGLFRLTGSGREFCAELRAVQGAVAGELWAPAGDLVARLSGLAERLVAAAWQTAGTAYAIIAGAGEPPEATPAHLLLTRLTALRYHRADAHAAAWAASGLTAAEVAELTGGPVRERIESDTNTRAGAPYGSLSADERSAWLDGLRTLPG